MVFILLFAKKILSPSWYINFSNMDKVSSLKP